MVPPPDPATLLQEGFNRLDEGDHLGLRRLCDDCLAKAPGHPVALFLQGVAELRQGPTSRASDLTEPLYRIQPHHPLFARLHALALECAGHLDEAEAVLDAAATTMPNDPDIAVARGIVAGKRGLPDRAESFFRRAAAMRPKSAVAWEGLAAVLQDQGRTEEAASAREFGRTPPDGLAVFRPVREPVFIIGCGRSGTTLVHRLLAAHPELIPTLAPPDHEDHEGWMHFGGALISGTGDDGQVSGREYSPSMDESQVTEAVVRSMHAYYHDHVTGRDGGKRVVNKNPHVSNKLRYVRRIFPDARFVHVIRDVVPFVGSWKHMLDREMPNVLAYWPDEAFPNIWHFPFKDDPMGRSRQDLFAGQDRIYPGGGFRRLPEFWAKVNANIPVQLADTPSQLMTIRYEDLCADPGGVLRGIQDFLGLRPFLVPTDAIRSANDKSRQVLSAEEQGICMEVGADTRRRFGYS
jgi:hypothetical protein